MGQKKRLIVFTLYDDEGASSQYRAFIFKDVLNRQFHTKWFHFWNNTYATKYMHNKKRYAVQICFQYIKNSIKRWLQFETLTPKADVIYIQKATIPKCKVLFLNRAKRAGTRIVFDVDDAIYVFPHDNSSEIAKIANTVICGNKTLAKYYSKFNKDIRVLPTVENTYYYEPYWRDTFDRKVIVWIGSKTTVNNLEIIKAPLNRFIKKHPEVEFHIISNDDRGYATKIKNTKLIIWNKNTYLKELAEATIGIMPLEDNELTRGKCGFKLIQYLNMKKPVIGSGVGVNSEIINGNGIVANTENEWDVAFEKILYNRKYYDSCVRHIEDDFFDKYHFGKVSQELVHILDE